MSSDVVEDVFETQRRPLNVDGKIHPWYTISNQGEVVRKVGRRRLSVEIIDGYSTVEIQNVSDKPNNHCYVDILVANSFGLGVRGLEGPKVSCIVAQKKETPPPITTCKQQRKMVTLTINHKDKNSLNNNLENLEWKSQPDFLRKIHPIVWKPLKGIGSVRRNDVYFLNLATNLIWFTR